MNKALHWANHALGSLKTPLFYARHTYYTHLGFLRRFLSSRLKEPNQPRVQLNSRLGNLTKGISESLAGMSYDTARRH